MVWGYACAWWVVWGYACAWWVAWGYACAWWVAAAGTDVERADPRDAKIVHLAKKNRNLALENAKLKDKAAAAGELAR